MSEKIEKDQLPEAWKKFKQTNDPVVRDQLICTYLHLIKYVVGKMAIRLPAHVRLDDLYSTGIIGLIKAIERYDLTRKNKFETYAILLIKGAIIDEMRSHDWVPRSVHQKANMISKAQQELEHKLGREATNEEIANSLKMSLKDFEELLSKVRPAVLVSLNADVNDDSERGTIADKIPDKKMKTSFETADRNEFRKLLEKTVSDLPEQERMVLVLYYYENLMLKEIAEVMRVSESRVSQVHTKALLRLRGRLHDFSEEFASFL